MKNEWNQHFAAVEAALYCALERRLSTKSVS